MQDNALLTQYAQNNSDAAFSHLVARYLPLVYRTCRRELGSDTLAEDAAQVVFLLLARKAKTLRAAPSLAGWLFQTARFVANDVRKQEARRRRREEAVMQEAVHAQAAPTPEWDSIEPHLNAALSALKPAERDAVLLRFFEGHTLAETGAFLGITEDAARMRCARALDKLRRYLTSHGAAVTGAVLTGFLTAEAVHPVPAHAAEAILQGTTQAISGTLSPNVLLLSKGVSHTMKLIKIKYAALAAGLLLAGVAVPSLVHAFSPHMAIMQVLPPPVSLQENSTAKFTLDTNQHAYYSATLPKGASLVILDTRWAESKASNLMFNYSITDKEAWLQGNTDSYGHYTVSSNDGSGGEGREVLQSNLKKSIPIILGVRNQGEQCQYRLTILSTASAVSDSEASPSFTVPRFGETLPKAIALSEIKTGQLEKNGYAYFLISLEAGRYQSRLDFSAASGKSTDLNGDMTLSDDKGFPLFDEKGNRLTPSEEGSYLEAATFKDVNRLHSSEVPSHDTSQFTLKKGGVYLITIKNEGTISSEADVDAVNFTEQIVSDASPAPTAKQN